MKKNENKKINHEFQRNFSPVFQRKKCFFGKSFIKDFGKNSNIALSSKKSKNKLFLPKKKIVCNASHHRRTKSNSNNMSNQDIANKNDNLNQSAFEISLIDKNNDLAFENDRNNYSSSTRNKSRNNFNEHKLINLLSINFSLKEFRNKIINSYSQNNLSEEKKIKITNFINHNNKNKKFDYNLEKSYNREETRNNTSISGGLNNTYLFVNRQISDSKEKYRKLYNQINCKSNKKLFSLKRNSTKNINQLYNKSNKKNQQFKDNFRGKIKNKDIKKNNNAKSRNTNNLILTKKNFQSGQKFSPNNKKFKISLFNPISKLNDYNFNYFESDKKKNKATKNIYHLEYKNKKIGNIGRYNKKDYENKLKNSNKGFNYDESCREFKSVEEIHFLYVYISQKKKEYFEKNNKEL